MRPPRRVAVAVTPRLLCDTLSRVLAREDREVTVLPVGQTPIADGAGDRPNEATRFDVAVVTDRLPDAVRADVVIRLPGPSAPAVARVGGRAVSLRGIDGLVELVDGCHPTEPGDPRAPA